MPRPKIHHLPAKLYMTAQENIQMFKFIETPELRNWWHDHDFFEVAIMLNSGGYHKTHKRKKKIEKGDVYFFNVGESHCYEMRKPSEILNLLMRKDFFIRLSERLGSSPHWAPLRIQDFIEDRRGGFAELKLAPAMLVKVRRLAEDWIHEDKKKQFGSPLMKQGYETEFFLWLIRAFIENAPKPDSFSISQKVKKVLDFIESEMARPIKLEEMAKLLPASAEHFGRWFKVQTGYTAFEYLNLIRIEKACRLLTDSKLPVQEIAFRCGFASLTLFFRLFKRHTGVTPRYYRSERRIKN